MLFLSHPVAARIAPNATPYEQESTSSETAGDCDVPPTPACTVPPAAGRNRARCFERKDLHPMLRAGHVPVVRAASKAGLAARRAARDVLRGSSPAHGSNAAASATVGRARARLPGPEAIQARP